MSSDPSEAAVLGREPDVIVRWILVNGVRPFRSENISAPVDHGDISTGRAEETQEPLTITVSPNTENIATDTDSGQTSHHGGGQGSWQERAGIVTVNCWAGSVDDFNNRNIAADPQDVRAEMKAEVIRSLSPYYQGTEHPTTGQKELESLSPAGVQEIPSEDTPPRYGFQIGVQYTYSRFSPSKQSFTQ